MATKLKETEIAPLLSTRDMMFKFGYATRAALHNWVKREGVPFIRMNTRRLMFDPIAVDRWVASRTTTKSGE